ncbi:hypothetical protein BT96DRAFT_1024003 [Gymnopus androsaceus JB14]|uniref:DNA recombination and repair protein Rad51-like C-terminal domain-containing protein n=1 Tax=Gymnopus androsaceus JB14 TaxID=1447944 RepID=A0A6A4H368_9AGAR|nr:hypothetical protein BT96DRAFT_1024003 [Gymnopus androsaceus JB14]
MASLFPNDDGPLLPKFSTLLVKGTYHATAPLNLALTFPTRGIIILSSRGQEKNGDSLRASLQAQTMTGKISALAEHVQILYPPTAAHMALLLSALQVFNTEQPAVNPSTSTSVTETKPYSPHVLKPPGPALIIIHELSAYFNNSNSSSPSSAYLSLLIRAISLASRLGSSLAVFDAHIGRLRMPVYRDLNPHLERVQEVASLAGNYIELTVDFDVGKADSEESSEDFGSVESGLFRLMWNAQTEPASSNPRIE